MQSYLKFNLPEDNSDFQCAVHGRDLSIILYEFDQYLRTKQKYENIETLSVDEIREKLREIMNENNLSFNNIIFN